MTVPQQAEGFKKLRFNVMLTIYLTEEQAAKLRAIAEKKGFKMSQMARMIIAEYLEKNANQA